MSVLATFLTDVCSVEVKTTTKTAAGSAVSSYVTVVPELACCVQPVTTAQEIEYGRLNVKVTHKVYVTAGTAIDERHRLLIGDDYFDVVQADSPLTTVAGRPMTVLVKRAPK